MTEGFRVVIDTNTYISATIFDNSTPRRVINHVKQNGIILISNETIHELYSVLFREKFDKYLSKVERAMFIRSVLDEVETVKITSHIADCTDPKDNKFLELALDGKANYIITGDDDLLRMTPFRGIEIVTPADFLLIK
jgi:putative PIN family toxin of toxin-antitoxin system